MVWRLAVAGERLDSTDPLLAHKTSRRELYERARAAVPADQADEVILLNERGEVCEGTFTNVFLAPPGSAGLLTPAAACGLLPGVLRAELLAERPPRSRAAAGGSRQGRAVRRQLAPGADCGMPCLSAGGLAGARLSRMRMTAGRERLPPRLRDLGGLLTEWPATEREWQTWRSRLAVYGEITGPS